MYDRDVAPHTALDLDALNRLGIALADATRRRILARLSEGPAYPAELARLLGASPANVSNHLACLRGCGLVTATPRGRRVLYELPHARLGVALRELAAVVVDLPARPGHVATRP